MGVELGERVRGCGLSENKPGAFVAQHLKWRDAFDTKSYAGNRYFDIASRTDSQAAAKFLKGGVLGESKHPEGILE